MNPIHIILTKTFIKWSCSFRNVINFDKLCGMSVLKDKCHNVCDYKTNFLMEIKGKNCYIFSEWTNMHRPNIGINSKLNTMMRRIIRDPARGLPHSIFVVKHAIYIRITPKLFCELGGLYSQSFRRTVSNHFLSISRKTNSTYDPEQIALRFPMKYVSVCWETCLQIDSYTFMLTNDEMSLFPLQGFTSH